MKTENKEKLKRMIHFLMIISIFLVGFSYTETHIHEQNHIRICEEDGGTGKVLYVRPFKGLMSCANYNNEIKIKDLADLQLEFISSQTMMIISMLAIYPLYWRIIKEI